MPNILQMTFAVWPIGHPDQRREFTGGQYGNGVFIDQTDLSGYAEGSVLAWAAQASDFTDTSAWSRPCFLTVDRTPPAKLVRVASRLYPEGTVATGGQGVKGTFRFDAQGDRDTVAFAYTDGSNVQGEVAARRPGGAATIDFTPTRAGPQWLEVTPLDAAGNRGTPTHYAFFVRPTAPWGTIDVAGVGLPSTVRLSSSLPEVTQFSYQLDGAAEVRFPSVNGTGTSTITFTATGYLTVTIRAYAGTKLVGADKLSVSVSDEPQVDSAEFNLTRDAVVGQSGSFTFKPRRNGVVAYEYDFGGGPQRITAAADGTAVLAWTAVTPQWYFMAVRSVQADGSLSQTASYQFNVVDDHPSAYASGLTNSPRTDGVGMPLEIDFTSWLPTVTGFVYAVSGGAEQTVPSDGPYARVTFVPEHAGDNTVVVRATLADGTESPATTYTFSVFNGPIVTWSPDGQGTVGRPVTFTFRPGLPGVSQYRYSIDDGPDQTIAAGPDGSATVDYAPQFPHLQNVKVTSIGAGGTESDQRWSYFIVRDNRVSVNSSYGPYQPRGGVGVSATFQFWTELFGEVASFRYHLDDQPEQTVPVTDGGGSAWVTVTLDRNGASTLYVQGVLGTGELTPVTAYGFLVGTAPRVTSAQYPEATWAGGAGVPGTFEFNGGTAGITSFDYRLDGGAAATVAADANGYAAITYTPAGDGEIHSLLVTGHLADGPPTDSTSYTFYVQ